MEHVSGHYPWHDLWQGLVVAAIVAAALVSVAGKYLPAGARRRLVALLTHGGSKPSKLATWINPKASGCGDGCSTCGSCDSAAPAPRQGRPVIKLHRLQ